ncbi:hypothetical protein [Sphingomonas asaccharolytica]|uniref:hypothetical protein n=1 Tax=Sphingomonas asaccharolytica TaxID=40681 RepID=UPI000830338E|nr:hypothetical protein [Sphingomonas asaccharolytica]
MILNAMITQAVITALPLLVFAVIGIVLSRRNARQTMSSAPIEVAADGTIAVPIHGLYLRRTGIYGGDSNNSINPRFAIGPEGIRYRVFRQSRLPFSAIDHVEVRERFGSVHLLFLNTSGPHLLSVNVGNRDRAKQVLNALPHTVALTPEAATIRDGAADAATLGLRVYHGRFA